MSKSKFALSIATAAIAFMLWAQTALATSMRSIWFVQPQRDNAVWVRSDEDADTGGKIGPATPQFVAQRRQSLDSDGQDRPKPFSMHEYVSGGNIKFQDGRTASGCIIPDAPGPGVVDHGVVNPFSGEIAGRQYCLALAPISAPSSVSAPASGTLPVATTVFQTGKGGTLAFGPGQSIAAFRICVGGTIGGAPSFPCQGGISRDMVYIQNSQFVGWALDGITTPVGTLLSSDMIAGLSAWDGR